MADLTPRELNILEGWLNDCKEYPVPNPIGLLQAGYFTYMEEVGVLQKIVEEYLNRSTA